MACRSLSANQDYLGFIHMTSHLKDGPLCVCAVILYFFTPDAIVIYCSLLQTAAESIKNISLCGCP